MNDDPIAKEARETGAKLAAELWDDIAATPEAVPVHDWQKEELARRKANLTKNPTSGLTGEEVKRRVRDRQERL